MLRHTKQSLFSTTFVPMARVFCDMSGKPVGPRVDPPPPISNRAGGEKQATAEVPSTTFYERVVNLIAAQVALCIVAKLLAVVFEYMSEINVVEEATSKVLQAFDAPLSTAGVSCMSYQLGKAGLMFCKKVLYPKFFGWSFTALGHAAALLRSFGGLVSKFFTLYNHYVMAGWAVRFGYAGFEKYKGKCAAPFMITHEPLTALGDMVDWSSFQSHSTLSMHVRRIAASAPRRLCAFWSVEDQHMRLIGMGYVGDEVIATATHVISGQGGVVHSLQLGHKVVVSSAKLEISTGAQVIPLPTAMVEALLSGCTNAWFANPPLRDGLSPPCDDHGVLRFPNLNALLGIKVARTAFAPGKGTFVPVKAFEYEYSALSGTYRLWEQIGCVHEKQPAPGLLATNILSVPGMSGSVLLDPRTEALVGMNIGSANLNETDAPVAVAIAIRQMYTYWTCVEKLKDDKTFGWPKARPVITQHSLQPDSFYEILAYDQMAVDSGLVEADEIAGDWETREEFEDRTKAVSDVHERVVHGRGDLDADYKPLNLPYGPLHVKYHSNPDWPGHTPSDAPVGARTTNLATTAGLPQAVAAAAANTLSLPTIEEEPVRVLPTLEEKARSVEAVEKVKAAALEAIATEAEVYLLPDCVKTIATHHLPTTGRLVGFKPWESNKDAVSCVCCGVVCTAFICGICATMLNSQHTHWVPSPVAPDNFIGLSLFERSLVSTLESVVPSPFAADADGNDFLFEIGKSSYKRRYNGNSTLSLPPQELLESLGIPETYHLPDRSANGVRSSMRANVSKRRSGNFGEDAEHWALLLTPTADPAVHFPVDMPSLGTDLIGIVRADLFKCAQDMRMDKSSGWSGAILGCAQKSDLMSKYGEDVLDTAARRVARFLLFPAFAATLGPLDLVRFGFRGVVIPEVKGELHPTKKVMLNGQKLKDPRWRSILMQDTADHLVHMYFEAGFNAGLVENYQSGEIQSTLAYGSLVGLATNESGIERIHALLGAMSEDGAACLRTSDVSGMDWSLGASDVLAAAAVRAQRFLHSDSPHRRRLAVGTYAASLAESRSVYLIEDTLYAANEGGVCQSGAFSTSEIDGFSRVADARLADMTSGSVLAYGDDCVRAHMPSLVEAGAIVAKPRSRRRRGKKAVVELNSSAPAPAPFRGYVSALDEREVVENIDYGSGGVVNVCSRDFTLDCATEFTLTSWPRCITRLAGIPDATKFAESAGGLIVECRFTTPALERMAVIAEYRGFAAPVASSTYNVDEYLSG